MKRSHPPLWWLPSREDYRGLTRSGLLRDVVAGASVAVVALPLALAFGIASGAGARAGLMTAIVAGAVAAVFGGSRLQVSGPTGAMAVVLAPIVATHGAGSVPLVALLAGLVIVAGAFAHVGRLMEYVPWPVIEGFTVGIALVIALQQVPLALGISVAPGTNAAVGAWRSLHAFAKQPEGSALVLLACSVLLMLLLPRLHRGLPASIITVTAVSLVAAGAHLDVRTVGALPRSLPAPRLPELAHLQELVQAAVVVAILAILESLLSARIADGLADGERHHPDREVLGQGLANLAAGLFGGMPATGALARTAVNARSGARTRLAALLHSVILAVLMLIAGGWVAHMALVSLAGVLTVTASRMVDLAAARRLLASTRGDVAVFVATAAATLALDLVRAVEIGVALAVLVTLVQLARRAPVVVDHQAVEIVADRERELLREHVVVYRLDRPLFFGAVRAFLEEMARVADVRVVVLRISGRSILDATGARALGEMVEDLQARGMQVVVKVADPADQVLLRAVGALEVLESTGRVVTDLDAALTAALALAS